MRVSINREPKNGALQNVILTMGAPKKGPPISGNLPICTVRWKPSHSCEPYFLAQPSHGLQNRSVFVMAFFIPSNPVPWL